MVMQMIMNVIRSFVPNSQKLNDIDSLIEEKHIEDVKKTYSPEEDTTKAKKKKDKIRLGVFDEKQYNTKIKNIQAYGCNMTSIMNEINWRLDEKKKTYTLEDFYSLLTSKNIMRKDCYMLTYKKPLLKLFGLDVKLKFKSMPFASIRKDSTRNKIIMDQIKQGNPVKVWVRKNETIGSHFLLIEGYELLKEDEVLFYINDPVGRAKYMDGKRRLLDSKKYPTSRVLRKIYWYENKIRK